MARFCTSRPDESNFLLRQRLSFHNSRFPSRKEHWLDYKIFIYISIWYILINYICIKIYIYIYLYIRYNIISFRAKYFRVKYFVLYFKSKYCDWEMNSRGEREREREKERERERERKKERETINREVGNQLAAISRIVALLAAIINVPPPISSLPSLFLVTGAIVSL